MKSSTGGARTFREEWAPAFSPIPEIYICYDRDDAGRSGARTVGQLIPQAKVAQLPASVGEGGDITDFFVRLGQSREDFIALLHEAEPVPPPPLATPTATSSAMMSTTARPYSIPRNSTPMVTMSETSVIPVSTIPTMT